MKKEILFPNIFIFSKIGNIKVDSRSFSCYDEGVKAVPRLSEAVYSAITHLMHCVLCNVPERG